MIFEAVPRDREGGRLASAEACRARRRALRRPTQQCRGGGSTENVGEGLPDQGKQVATAGGISAGDEGLTGSLCRRGRASRARLPKLDHLTGLRSHTTAKILRVVHYTFASPVRLARP